jgi:hypothetical protein
MDRFEKLAKDMAGMSRRDALRRAGGGLAGALLGAFGLGRARASEPNGGEDNPCEVECDFLFGGPNVNRPGWGRCMNSCGKCVNSAGGTCFTGFPSCENEPNCICSQTVEGGGFCLADFFCACAPICSSNLDCPAGFGCVTNGGCGTCGETDIGLCAPPCSVSPVDIFSYPPCGAGTSPVGPTFASI